MMNFQKRINFNKSKGYGQWVVAGLLVTFMSFSNSFAQQKSTDVNLNLKLASEYVFRGISQTDEKPAIQADFSIFTPASVYAGVWVSNVDKPWGGVYNKGFSNEDIEYDLYFGHISRSPDGKGNFDVGLIRYGFAPDDDDRSWSEAYLGVSHSGLALKMSVHLEGAEMGNYYEASYRGSVKKYFDYSVHYGYYDLDVKLRGFLSYADFNAGISKTIKGYKMELKYFKNDKDGEGRYLDVADDRFVVSVSKNLNLKKLMQKK